MLNRAASALINIIYPPLCLICKQSVPQGTVVCGSCLQKLENNLPPFCVKCGRNTGRAHCENKLHFDRAFSACCYKGTAKELIHLFKYKGKAKLAATLTRAISEFINKFRIPMGNFDIITSIPLHPARQREREFNQAEIISGRLSREFGLAHSSQNLIRIRNIKTQTKLTAKNRFLNMRGVFKIKNVSEFMDKNVLVIDDVLTTGATCSEAAKTLKGAGAKSVCVLTFAS